MGAGSLRSFWLGAFLSKRQLTEPNGSPLWSYRISSAEFETLGSYLRDEILGPKLPEWYVSQLFCLWAADAWRRLYDGKGWKWEVLERQLGLSLGESCLHRLVAEGLPRWRRRLLLDATGKRQFLVTLIVEGGLPLHLIQQDGSGLQVFFRKLLASSRHLESSESGYLEITKRLGETVLPKNLQREEIFRLSWALVDEVWNLQRKLGESVEDPLKRLDELDPGWREGIPLDISDKTATALLENLVRDANDIAASTTNRIRMERGLVAAAEENIYRLRARLLLPEYIENEAFASLIGSSPEALPARMELLLQSSEGAQFLTATAHELIDAQGRSRYRIETRAAPNKNILQGKSACAQFSLCIHPGVGSVDFTGSKLADDLPWVFAPDQAGDWFLLGVGAVSSRRGQLRVAAPLGWRGSASSSGGTLTLIGSLESSRELWVVEGLVEFFDETSRVRVRASAPIDSLLEFRLFGRSELYGEKKIYLGFPSLSVFGPEGEPKGGDSGLRWRPVGSRGHWRQGSNGALGRLNLRVEHEGALLYSETVDVAPDSFSVGLRPNRDGKSGEILLSGLQGARVVLEKDDDLDCKLIVEGTVSHIQVLAKAEIPPSILLRLEWEDGRTLSLLIPFPLQGSRFLDRSGRDFGRSATVPLERIAGLRAVASTVDEDSTFWVSARLFAEDFESKIEFEVYLSRTGLGRHELDLGSLQEQCSLMLGASSLLDSYVILRIETNIGPAEPRQLRVARFDSSLEFNQRTGEVMPSQIQTFENLRVEATPLWELRAEPLLLESSEESLIFAPARRQAGPWLITGWDGNWCRYRPRVWAVGIEGETVRDEGLSPLQKAIRTEGRESRAKKIAGEIERLCGKPVDDDWQLITTAVQLQRALPAGSLDLLRQLVKVPAAVALLALTARADELLATWKVIQDQLFSWRLIPLRTWAAATHALRLARIEQIPAEVMTLQKREKLADSVLRRNLAVLADHRGFMAVIADWLRFEVLEDFEAGARLMVSTEEAPVSTRMEAGRQDLMRRAIARQWPRVNKAREFWPQEKRVAGQEKLWAAFSRQLGACRSTESFKWATLEAPLWAALVSAIGLEYQSAFIFDLRVLRAFDPDYYDDAYELALRLALGILERENRETLE